VTVTFVESSALVKLVVSEEGSKPLKRWLAGRSLASSALSRVEVSRAVRRSGLRVHPTVDQVLGSIQTVALDDAVLQEARALDPPALGTFDAIHLASALRLGPTVDAFVTYDRRLGRAAAAAGFRVESPR
jgi:predicted nucleic acid-binding protein